MNDTGRATCIYCGTERGRAEPFCPECAMPWIDQALPGPPGDRIRPPASPLQPAAAVSPTMPARPAPSVAPPAPEPEPPRRRRRRPVTLVFWALGLAAVAIWAAVFALWLGDRGTDEAGPTTSAATTQPATTEPATTQPVATTGTPTTTSAPTTTAAPATTTTSPATSIPPLPVDELRLGAFALGAVDFGTGTGPALEALTALLGDPDSTQAVVGEAGLCPDDNGTVVRWGPLTAVFGPGTGGDEFVGYRLDRDPDHPAAALATISGLRVGDTVADLERIYSGFTIEFEESAGSPHFRLVRSTDGSLLLWGPVGAATPEGTIDGIYSPNACDGGSGV